MNVRTFIKVDKAAFYRFIQTEPEGRYEYEWGRIVQQPGGTFIHSRIATRFLFALKDACEQRNLAMTPDRGVETAETIRYPDIVVESDAAAPDSRWTKEPVLVIEVLSPTSVSRDLDVKPIEYLKLRSLQAYVVASQEEAACMLWVRDRNGNFPVEPVILTGDDKIIDIPTLSLSIPISDIYAGLFKSAPPKKD
ncbi:MAG: Uma2 family endonuclease [Hyphomicrobiaceae bacterium]